MSSFYGSKYFHLYDKPKNQEVIVANIILFLFMDLLIFSLPNLKTSTPRIKAGPFLVQAIHCQKIPSSIYEKEVSLLCLKIENFQRGYLTKLKMILTTIGLP